MCLVGGERVVNILYIRAVYIRGVSFALCKRRYSFICTHKHIFVTYVSNTLQVTRTANVLSASLNRTFQKIY